MERKQLVANAGGKGPEEQKSNEIDELKKIFYEFFIREERENMRVENY